MVRTDGRTHIQGNGKEKAATISFPLLLGTKERDSPIQKSSFADTLIKSHRSSNVAPRVTASFAPRRKWRGTGSVGRSDAEGKKELEEKEGGEGKTLTLTLAGCRMRDGWKWKGGGG